MLKGKLPQVLKYQVASIQNGEEVQKSPIVITSDSSERASNALPALEGAPKDAFREACASLEDETLAGRPPSADKIVGEAPFAETDVARRARLDGLTSQLPVSAGQGVLIG